MHVRPGVFAPRFEADVMVAGIDLLPTILALSRMMRPAHLSAAQQPLDGGLASPLASLSELPPTSGASSIGARTHSGTRADSPLVDGESLLGLLTGETKRLRRKYLFWHMPLFVNYFPPTTLQLCNTATLQHCNTATLQHLGFRQRCSVAL
jgi:hypothetical protein